MKALNSVVLAVSVGFAHVTFAMPSTHAKAELKDSKGLSLGTADLEQTPQGVLLVASLSHLPPGTHAFHIHEKGSCVAPDFKSAGGHFNPKGHQHGARNPQGMHEGDLANFTVSAEGQAKIEALLPMSQLRGTQGLLDADRAALVVHAKADDYASNPAGNAGDRIACGVIE